MVACLLLLLLLKNWTPRGESTFEQTRADKCLCSSWILNVKIQFSLIRQKVSSSCIFVYLVVARIAISSWCTFDGGGGVDDVNDWLWCLQNYDRPINTARRLENKDNTRGWCQGNVDNNYFTDSLLLDFSLDNTSRILPPQDSIARWTRNSMSQDDDNGRWIISMLRRRATAINPRNMFIRLCPQIGTIRY